MRKEEQSTTDINTIKLGTFQLQTKSFWLGLVSILVLFLLTVIWLNTYYWYNISIKIIDSQKQVIIEKK